MKGRVGGTNKQANYNTEYGKKKECGEVWGYHIQLPDPENGSSTFLLNDNYLPVDNKYTS
jgi:hypothetical protein